MSPYEELWLQDMITLLPKGTVSVDGSIECRFSRPLRTVFIFEQCSTAKQRKLQKLKQNSKVTNSHTSKQYKVCLKFTHT